MEPENGLEKEIPIKIKKFHAFSGSILNFWGETN